MGPKERLREMMRPALIATGMTLTALGIGAYVACVPEIQYNTRIETARTLHQTATYIMGKGATWKDIADHQGIRLCRLDNQIADILRLNPGLLDRKRVGNTQFPMPWEGDQITILDHRTQIGHDIDRQYLIKDGEVLDIVIDPNGLIWRVPE